MSQLLQFPNPSAEAKKKERFVPREFIHTPGTKEGWEIVVQNDNRVIIIEDEGDEW